MGMLIGDLSDEALVERDALIDDLLGTLVGIIEDGGLDAWPNLKETTTGNLRRLGYHVAIHDGDCECAECTKAYRGDGDGSAGDWWVRDMESVGRDFAAHIRSVGRSEREEEFDAHMREGRG